MKVFIEKNADYSVIPNLHLKEKEMSLKAKGLLSLMFTLPKSNDYTILSLAELSKDGKDGVMKALQEIEKFNYLKRVRVKDVNGKFIGFDYFVYESPYAEKPYTEKPNMVNIEKKEKKYTKKEIKEDSIINNNIYNKELLNNLKDFKELNNINNIQVLKEKETKEKENNTQEIIDEIDEMFTTFWKQYPKKVNKQGCYKSFKRIKNLKKEFTNIINSLNNFKKTKDWTKNNGQFIPHPQTFINQRRWEDVIEVNEREKALNNLNMDEWV